MIAEGFDYLSALWARVPASRLSAATAEKFDDDNLYIHCRTIKLDEGLTIVIEGFVLILNFLISSQTTEPPSKTV